VSAKILQGGFWFFSLNVPIKAIINDLAIPSYALIAGQAPCPSSNFLTQLIPVVPIIPKKEAGGKKLKANIT